MEDNCRLVEKGEGMAGSSTTSQRLDLMKLFALRDQFGSTAKKGDIIYSPDQPAEEFYVLMKGRVQVEVPGFGTETAGPGDVFGEVDVFAHRQRGEQATALDDCNLLAFNADSAIQLAEATPSFALVVLRQVCERLAQAEEIIASGAVNPADDKPKVHVPAAPVGPGGQVGPVTAVDYADKLWKKDAKCPNCRTAFKAWNIRSAAVVAGTRESDYRVVYDGPDPNLYRVWVCPNCQLAANEEDFPTMSSVQLARAKPGLEETKKADPTTYDFGYYRDENLALRSYQLAIPFYDGTKGGAEKCAGLYHRMAWIERGRDNPDQEKIWLTKAAEYYEKAFTSSDSGKQGVLWAYLIGELNTRIGDYQKAVKWFTTAAAQPDFKAQSGLEKQTRDRWGEVNDMLRKTKAG
jgi:uncharacterized protein (DUF2225 family)